MVHAPDGQLIARQINSPRSLPARTFRQPFELLLSDSPPSARPCIGQRLLNRLCVRRQEVQAQSPAP